MFWLIVGLAALVTGGLVLDRGRVRGMIPEALTGMLFVGVTTNGPGAVNPGTSLAAPGIDAPYAAISGLLIVTVAPTLALWFAQGLRTENPVRRTLRFSGASGLLVAAAVLTGHIAYANWWNPVIAVAYCPGFFLTILLAHRIAHGPNRPRRSFGGTTRLR